MAEVKLSANQRLAVEDRGGSLLISAAAGSGKTKVLVQRLFSYLEGEHAQVDDFLIITYTKAAAAELRSRIARELSLRVAEQPENAHLRRQLYRVYLADIKTVDAFCVGLLRQNAHLLPGGLTPDFRVLDEKEALDLRERVLARVLDQFYDGIEAQENRRLLAETLGAGRDDRALAQLTLEIYDKVQSHPYPALWLEEERRKWTMLPVKMEETVYGREILSYTRRRCDYWAHTLRRAVSEMAADAALTKGYADRFAQVALELERADALLSGGWDAMADFRPEFPRLGAVRGDSPLKARMKAIQEQCKADLKKLAEPFSATAAEHLSDVRAMAPAMDALLTLTLDFSDAYQKEKRRRNVMDFSDQEHDAIALLLNPDGTPTELAQQVSTRYQEIMVDEYQDANEVQDCLFSAISKEGKNLFTVGDVKQSIYRFRLADPSIFLRRYARSVPAGDAEAGQDRRVVLLENYRSRDAILQGANFVFNNIMTREMGELDYRAEGALRAGLDLPAPPADDAVEFHYLSVENTEEETFDRTAVEAQYAARRVRCLLDEGYPVRGEDGTLRPVTPEDIVLLMRSPRARLGTFLAALRRENIPCSSGETIDFFASPEIAVTFSFLQIIDNPRQDVPLIAVLRSPLFGFTADRLAKIRSLAPRDDFYEALTLDESADSRAFLALLERLRTLAQDLTADQLLWRLYQIANVPAVFGMMGQGTARRARLTAFYEYTRQMVQNGKRSTFAFVTYLRRLLEEGRAPELSAQQSCGGVRVMSIHASKGLEFPVVLLCDLQKSFNQDDFKRQVLVHPQMGLGVERVDLTRRIRYDTLSKRAVAQKLTRESKAEEERILYVAMTRAKDKLILVDCVRGGQKHLAGLAAAAACPPEAEAVASLNSLGDWILLPLLCRVEAAPLRAGADCSVSALCADDGQRWDVHYCVNPGLADAEIAAEEPEKVRAAQPFDPQPLEQVYPHASAVLAPSKVTATQLKGRERDAEIAEGSPKPVMRQLSFETPAFLSGTRKLTAAQRGTALHLVMQYLDFALPPTAEAVRAVVDGLVQRRLLGQPEAAAVDASAIAAFLASPLAGEIRAAAQVWREYRFALLLPADAIDPSLSPEDRMMLQGVADCCFEEGGGLTVVDFKTDRLAPGEEAARAAHYRPQLEAYAAALTRVLEKEVKRKILYFFATNTAVEL
jgi:ATP-dependent helicase/nuclease subunit A